MGRKPEYFVETSYSRGKKNWKKNLNPLNELTPDLIQATLVEADSSLSYTEHCWKQGFRHGDPSRTFIFSKDKLNIYIFNKKVHRLNKWMMCLESKIWFVKKTCSILHTRCRCWQRWCRCWWWRYSWKYYKYTNESYSSSLLRRKS